MSSNTDLVSKIEGEIRFKMDIMNFVQFYYKTLNPMFQSDLLALMKKYIDQAFAGLTPAEADLPENRYVMTFFSNLPTDRECDWRGLVENAYKSYWLRNCIRMILSSART